MSVRAALKAKFPDWTEERRARYRFCRMGQKRILENSLENDGAVEAFKVAWPCSVYAAPDGAVAAIIKGEVSIEKSEVLLSSAEALNARSGLLDAEKQCFGLFINALKEFATVLQIRHTCMCGAGQVVGRNLAGNKADTRANNWSYCIGFALGADK